MIRRSRARLFRSKLSGLHGALIYSGVKEERGGNLRAWPGGTGDAGGAVGDVLAVAGMRQARPGYREGMPYVRRSAM